MGERPLLGKTVVVTRPVEQSESLARPLENLGAEVLLAPTIRIVPIPLNDEIRGAVTRLATYQLVIFTSVNGVAEFLGRMRECGVGTEALAGATVAAIGPRTAAALAAQGVEVGIVPEEYIAEGLLAALDVAGEGARGRAGRRAPLRVLLARAREAREILPDTLRERGALVDVLPVYETAPVDALAVPLARIAAADYLTFTAASTVRRFVELAARDAAAEEGASPDDVGDGAGRETPAPAPGRETPAPVAGSPLAERLAGARIVSIGPATSEAVRAAGLTVACEARDHNVHGIVTAIVADVASRPASA